jgi:hypothetical protein
MQDSETKTLWNHITGDAMQGPLLGRSLGPVSNLLQMTVGQALKMDASTRVAISDRRYGSGGQRSRVVNPNATMADRFVATIGTEDTRRPRMDIGLGVWIGSTARYYPIQRIRERGEAFIDRIGGRTLLVYIESASNTPAALFVDAKSASREGEGVRLDDGSTVRDGIWLDRRGQRRSADRPAQMFTRWYGFALTFAGCEIFGD